MHELTEKARCAINELLQKTDQSMNIFEVEILDQIIREWLEEKAEIFGGNARNVLGIAEKTLEEKIDDWFKKSHGQYGSGQEWREACKKAIAEIADQHFNK